MIYVDIVIALALLQFLAFGFKVGGARDKFGVKAPATAGHETFERHFRVHQNTLEQLILFLPGIYLFGRYFQAEWAAILGVVYLIGRQLYGMAYVKDPAKRSLGFALTFFPNVALIVGGLAGAIWHLIRG
jgi:glutathione S-transferase